MHVKYTPCHVYSMNINCEKGHSKASSNKHKQCKCSFIEWTKGNHGEFEGVYSKRSRLFSIKSEQLDSSLFDVLLKEGIASLQGVLIEVPRKV